ncbi:Hypothetical_protein [Hexamita inflata]|uniref:Hypothetical_protein n=1 Tax=Hexamita inflata TaxID=28002 RepID=A0AA86QJE8_9EUKA|nr:Hypothetical protein HINF_LOCUS47053 [Hexamita inflata]
MSQDLQQQKEARQKKILEGQKKRMALIYNTTEDKVHMPEEYHQQEQKIELDKEKIKELIGSQASVKRITFFSVMQFIVTGFLFLGLNLNCLVKSNETINKLTFNIQETQLFENLQKHQSLTFFFLELLFLLRKSLFGSKNSTGMQGLIKKVIQGGKHFILRLFIFVGLQFVGAAYCG